MIRMQRKYYFKYLDKRLPAKFKFCIFSQLRRDSSNDKKQNSALGWMKKWFTQYCRRNKTTQQKHSPKLEILFEDKLSTDRCLRDARGAKFEILLTERSNRSRFIHSPIHPRSCIPARQPVDNSVRTMLNRESNNVWSIISYQDLWVWGRGWTPSQTLLCGTWAGRQRPCHSLCLKESER